MHREISVHAVYFQCFKPRFNGFDHLLRNACRQRFANAWQLWRMGVLAIWAGL
jgi:hypothetical protein